MVPKPQIKPNDFLAFLKHSHGISGIRVTDAVIKETMDPKNAQKSPFVKGHLLVANYAAQRLLGSPDFPCPPNPPLTHWFQTDNRLGWLKEIHRLMSDDLAKAGAMNPWDVGVWREKPLRDDRGKPKNRPAADQIPQLLSAWYRDLAAFSDRMRSVILMPERMSYQDACDLAKKAYETNLELCRICPFQDGNGRVARLVELVLRAHWYLPFKTIEDSGGEEEVYRDDIRRWCRSHSASVPSPIPDR